MYRPIANSFLRDYQQCIGLCEIRSMVFKKIKRDHIKVGNWKLIVFCESPLVVQFCKRKTFASAVLCPGEEFLNEPERYIIEGIPIISLAADKEKCYPSLFVSFSEIESPSLLFRRGSLSLLRKRKSNLIRIQQARCPSRRKDSGGPPVKGRLSW